MLTSPARLCPGGPAHAAATAGFSIQEEEIPRETDCLLEECGFELTVPSDRSVSNQRRQPFVMLGGLALERARKPPKASEERCGLGSGEAAWIRRIMSGRGNGLCG